MALQLSLTEQIQQQSASQNIPDITFRKMDEAVVDYFDKKFPLLIDGRKVPVVFAGPERWAQVQKDSYLRDKDGMLILPVIAVRRGTPEINNNRHVPKDEATNIIIKKSIKNKIDSMPLKNEKQLYDYYSVPYPRFLNMSYTIIIWASHYTEINDFQQRYLWEGSHFVFNSEHFWFQSHIQSINDTSNNEDNTRQERIQRIEYSLMLEGYILNSKDVKKFAPIRQINFDIKTDLIELEVDKRKYKYSSNLIDNPVRL